MKHIIWDWNGTLLNDLPVIIDAVNETVEQVGIRRITLDDYRTYYTRPVKLFYDEIAGREIDRDEWERIDRMFHETYHASVDRASLATGAREVLAEIKRGPHGQSLLSMAPNSELRTALHLFDVAQFFQICKEMRGHLAVSRPSTLPIISPVSTRIGRC